MRLLCVCAGVVFLLLTVYGWFIPEPGPNELSRLDLAFALVKQRSTSIDAYHDNTIDRALYEGRYYSDKPLGLPLLAAPVLLVLDRALRLGDMGVTRVSYVAHLLNVSTVALAAACLVPLVGVTAHRLGARPAASVLAGAALGLGTALLPFATTFYAHATSAAFAFAAFALASGALLRERPRLASFAAGLSAGLAGLVEYPVIVVGLVLLGWLVLARRSVGEWLAYLVGGAVALAPLPFYNWASFGAPWRLGYSYISPEAFQGMTVGFFGLTRPSVEALAEITVGPGGLLAQSPWLALAPIGLGLMARRGRGAAAGTAALLIGTFLLYNASYYLPMGGQSSGPRFLVPTLPFLALGLAFLPLWSWLVVGPMALFSAVHMVAIAAVEPKPGPGAPDPFFTYWWPRWVVGDVTQSWGEVRWGLHGMAAAAPLVVPLGLAALAGLLALSPRVRQGSWSALSLLAVGALSWSVLALPVTVRGVPVPFRLSAVEEPAQKLGMLYGDTIELVGYELPGEARPGDWLDVVLFWRARAREGENLIVAVHAVGRNAANLAGYDGAPVGAGFPTNMWRPGELLRMPYRLRLDERAEAPTALGVTVALRGPGNVGRPVLPRDAAGRLLEDGPVVARIALRGPPTPAPGSSQAEFVDGLELVDWQVPTAIKRGEMLAGQMRFRAARPVARDATVFVQLLGSGGPLAQSDSQPRGGSYPTSLWAPGEVVVDEFALRIPADAPPGAYRLIAGLYVLPEVRRLTLTTGADHVVLGVVQLQP